jgi:hypothetical protein
LFVVEGWQGLCFDSTEFGWWLTVCGIMVFIQQYWYSLLQPPDNTF